MSLDTIAIAFHQSTYATPHTDHTIPGNHPGHRDYHLGRQYAPDPTTHSTLTCALYVPGTELGLGGVCPTDLNNHVHHTFLPRDSHNGSYVLHAPHGGRRHFPEERGTEDVWQPGLCPMGPPPSDALRCAPMRKALGVYNNDSACRMPEVIWARAQRELCAERARAGKAIVYRRPDHPPEDLGLRHIYGVLPSIEPRAAETPAASPREPNENPEERPEGAASPPPLLLPLPQGTATGAEGEQEATALPFLAQASGWEGQSVRGVYHGTQRAEQRIPRIEMVSAYAARRRKAAQTRARLEDIRLVQLLPK